MNIEKIRNAFREGYAYRLTPGMRVQHVLFAVELTVLIVTGLPLMFADSDFGVKLVGLMGGFEVRGLIHRVAAVALMAQTLFYLGYLFLSSTGRSELSDRLISGGDVGAFLGAWSSRTSGSAEARIGKYGLGQKLHFWLAGVMVVTMIVSGLLLWFPTQAMNLLPPWLMHVVLIAHGYEGMLALVVLVLWHLYAIHLSPRHFPMNQTWLSGRMPLEEAKAYHPLEYERLKALVDSDE